MSHRRYDEYIRCEWEQFVAHPQRADIAAEIRRHSGPIHRVLDIGCGAGQELLPYLDNALCFGFDVSADGPALARKLLRQVRRDARLALGRARAEALPIGAGAIDLVICRLVLPYTHTPTALAEVARVLRPGGSFSVQIHGPMYYVHKFQRALAERNRRELAYAARVLRTGICFHVTGRHRAIRGSLETFITIARLRRMAAVEGLELVTRIRAARPDTPHLVFRKG